MKRCFLLVLALCLLFSVNVGALSLDEYNLKITLPEDYSVLTEEGISQETDLIEQLGHSVTSMRQYFKDNSLILFALSPDSTRQVQITCRETEFSKRLTDLALLDDDEVLNLVNHFVKVKTAADLTLVIQNDMKMYEVVSTDKDSGGSFTTVQYITVRGGKLYTVSFFESSATPTADFKEFANQTASTLIISSKSKVTLSGTKNVTEMIIVGVLFVLAAILAITVIISLTRDLIHRDENGKPIIIRRRKK
ncbi:MAG: hypothetical protein IKL44_04550 [Clostridia bacterium]|nr:hypothetical protein [Clostridia bacterium]MBR3593928.1 hypothetical protein [Clostridia bacterium]